MLINILQNSKNLTKEEAKKLLEEATNAWKNIVSQDTKLNYKKLLVNFKTIIGKNNSEVVDLLILKSFFYSQGKDIGLITGDNKDASISIDKQLKLIPATVKGTGLKHEIAIANGLASLVRAGFIKENEISKIIEGTGFSLFIDKTPSQRIVPSQPQLNAIKF